MLYHGQAPEAWLAAITLGAAHAGFAAALVGHGVTDGIMGAQLYDVKTLINRLVFWIKDVLEVHDQQIMTAIRVTTEYK